MEVTQQLQPLQDKACQLFIEIENQGTELEQVINLAQQCLEGSMTVSLIQEFVKQEAVAMQQVEAAQAKLKAFKVELIRPE
jgi:hypothetical protein